MAILISRGSRIGRFLTLTYRNSRFVVYQIVSFSLIVWICVWFVNHFRDLEALEDQMLLSGFIATIVGIIAGVVIDRDPMKMVELLHTNGVVNIDEPDLRKIRRGLTKTFVVAQIVFCLVLLLLKEFIVERLWNDRELDPPSVVFYLLIGARLGRVVANGAIGQTIRKFAHVLELHIDHRDRAGGLATIGKFYVLQGTVLVIPVVWILTWIVLIQVNVNVMPQYERWKDSYILLLFVVSIVIFVGFIWPMWSFRRLIIEWKKRNGVETVIVRTRGHLMAVLRRYWATCRISEQVRIRTRVRELTDQLHSLSMMSDWPVSYRSIGVYIFGTALPLILALLSIAIALLDLDV